MKRIGKILLGIVAVAAVGVVVCLLTNEYQYRLLLESENEWDDDYYEDEDLEDDD